MVVIRVTKDNKYWQGCGEKESLLCLQIIKGNSMKLHKKIKTTMKAVILVWLYIQRKQKQ
jgi:hypothetical protein